MALGIINPDQAAELVAARILAAVERGTDLSPTTAEATLDSLHTSYRAGVTVTVSTGRLMKGLQSITPPQA